MLLREIPGYEYPTVALFPFRWYEAGNWIIRALKALPSGEVKWMYHCIEHNGHAKAQAFATYEEGRAFASDFNDGIASKVRALELTEVQRVSLTLKATKEVTVQARLADEDEDEDEEQMMLEEALRRHASTTRPARERLILPSGSEALRESLFEQLKQMPYLELFFSLSSIPLWLARENSTGRVASVQPKNARCIALVKKSPEGSVSRERIIGAIRRRRSVQSYCPGPISFCSWQAFRKCFLRPEHAANASS